MAFVQHVQDPMTPAICKALGLDMQLVYGVTIEMEPGRPASILVRHMATKEIQEIVVERYNSPPVPQ